MVMVLNFHHSFDHLLLPGFYTFNYLLISTYSYYKMSKFVVFVMFCIAVAVASVVKRQAAPTAYVLPDGVELILGQINGGFSCEGRIYGYYADRNNDCKVFHVCVPVVLADGSQETHTYSFFCGNQTVFDQAQLVCQHPQDATPCDQAEGFYNVNENFGKTDRPLLRA